MMQVDAGLFPVALHRPFRHPRHGGDLREREPAEELQVDDTRQPGVDGGQFVERIAQRAQIGRVGNGFGDIRANRRDLELAAPLLRLPAAGVVDDEPSHHPRRIRHEAIAIRKRGPLAAGDIQVRVVQERGRAQRHAGAAPGQLPARHAVQLLVQRGEERIGSGAIALLGGSEEGREIGTHSGSLAV